MALSIANQTLSVSPVEVNPESINLFWGIPYDIVVNEMQLGIVVNDPSSKHRSLQTFDIGFTVNQTTPIESQYEIRVTVGAFSIL